MVSPQTIFHGSTNQQQNCTYSEISQDLDCGRNQKLHLTNSEAWAKKNDIDMEDWPHGQTARALLYIDRGMRS